MTCLSTLFTRYFAKVAPDGKYFPETVAQIRFSRDPAGLPDPQDPRIPPALGAKIKVSN